MARDGALEDVAICDLNLEVNTFKPWIPQLLQFESCLEINHPPAYEDGVGQGHENHHEVELEAGCKVPPPGERRGKTWHYDLKVSFYISQKM